MFSFLRPQSSHRPQPRTRLGVESLDERLAPAVYASGGALIVTGTAGSDSVTVSEGYNRDYTVYVNGRSTSVPKSQVWAGTVRFFGDAGNDYFGFATNSVPLRLEAHGGGGNDQIWGGRYNDAISGETGDDQLHGGDGNDSVYGDGGNDTLHGDNGSDVVVGGIGNDTLYGGSGKDYLYGGFGSDTYYVYNDADSVFDGGGNDRVYQYGRWRRV